MPRYLAIYLNDHLAGATLGVELSRRVRDENGGSELGAFLAELHREIDEDRTSLLTLMDELGVKRSPVKARAAWVAEKLGRLKLNGQVRGYSPLSPLLELEGLATGVEAKLALWLALREVRPDDERLTTLIDRARSQRERLEPHRLAAARRALG